MKLSSGGFLVLSLFIRLSQGLLVVQVTNSHVISKDAQSSAKHSSLELLPRPGLWLNQDKTNLASNPTKLAAGVSAQQTQNEQSESQYGNVVGGLVSEPTASDEIPSTPKGGFVAGEHVERIHSRAYGRAHNYALVCAGNRWDTSYCQGAFLRYSCNSYGRLVQMEGGMRSETCNSICTCVNLSPKPFCLSGYLGTTTCF